MSVGMGVLQPRDFGIGRLFWKIREAVIVGDAASGRIVFWNPAAIALFGYSAEEASGQLLEMLVPEHLRARHRAGLARFCQTGHGPVVDSPAALELPALHASGRELTIELTLAPIDLAPIDVAPIDVAPSEPAPSEATPGGGRFVLAIIRDVSERKRAEQARLALAHEQAARGQAEDARRRLQFLAEASTLLADSLDFETTLDTVIGLALPTLADFGFFDVVVADGQVRRISRAHQDPRRQAILETTSWVRSDRTDMNLCGLSSGVSGFHPDIADDWLVRASGSPEHLALMRELGFCSMITVPLLYRDRRLGALTLFFADSGRHHTAADLALAEELARRAAAAVENARLFKEAREAIVVRDEFLSVAAHELKTPITSLLGLAQMMLRQLDRGRELDPARVRGVIEPIARQAKKLSLLVSQLLDVSRIRAGQLELDPRPADLASLVEEAATAARARTTLHTIRVQTPATVPAVVDPIRLEQVLTNLLDNAVKYSPAGGSIDVELARSEQTICISVADRGLGIPPEHRERIFDRFHQVHVVSHAPGLGLGLYISREIVTLHGGRIDVEDRPDGGARFVVTLPT